MPKTTTKSKTTKSKTTKSKTTKSKKTTAKKVSTVMATRRPTKTGKVVSSPKPPSVAHLPPLVIPPQRKTFPHPFKGCEDIITRVEVMTPKRATVLMSRNVCNRKFTKSRVTNYTRYMGQGEWVYSNDAIWLDKDGTVVNGQHRLTACIASGIDFACQVVYNVDRKWSTGLDQVGNRTASQKLWEAGHGDKSAASKLVRALARPSLEKQGTGIKLSPAETVDLFELYEDGINFVLEHVSGQPRCGRATYRAALVRAYYYVAEDVLIRFMNIVSGEEEGLSSKLDNGAVLFRSFLHNSYGVKAGGNGDKHVHGKTERALIAFVNREPIERLVAFKDEQFPLVDCDMAVIPKGT